MLTKREIPLSNDVLDILHAMGELAKDGDLVEIKAGVLNGLGVESGQARDAARQNLELSGNALSVVHAVANGRGLSTEAWIGEVVTQWVEHYGVA